LQSAIELRTLFGGAWFFEFDCQRTVIESRRRSVGPYRIFDFAPNLLCDRVRQSRWSRTGGVVRTIRQRVIVIGKQIEPAVAGRAVDVGQRRIVEDFDRILAMGTADLHGVAIVPHRGAEITQLFW
jgi:hypothetical protein